MSRYCSGASLQPLKKKNQKTVNIHIFTLLQPRAGRQLKKKKDDSSLVLKMFLKN